MVLFALPDNSLYFVGCYNGSNVSIWATSCSQGILFSIKDLLQFLQIFCCLLVFFWLPLIIILCNQVFAIFNDQIICYLIKTLGSCLGYIPVKVTEKKSTSFACVASTSSSISRGIFFIMCSSLSLSSPKPYALPLCHLRANAIFFVMSLRHLSITSLLHVLVYLSRDSITSTP